MKTIANILILSLLVVYLTSCAHKQSDKYTKVIIQSIEPDISIAELKQSSQIITERLKTYGIKSFKISVAENENQISLQLPKNIDLPEIERLFTSQGELFFYETLTLSNIEDSIKSDSIFDPLDARIGCSNYEDPDMKAKIVEYLKAKSLYSNCTLLWSVKNDEALTCLYALKLNDSGGPLLTKSDIESIKSIQNKDNGFTLELRFQQRVAQILKKSTTVNINKPIAIVIDNKVFYAPVVRSTIENGICEITGNLTQKEDRLFLALVNNDPLPTNLKLLK